MHIDISLLKAVGAYKRRLFQSLIFVASILLLAFFGGKKYMGLVERVMVSEYQIYYFVIGLLVYLRN